MDIIILAAAGVGLVAFVVLAIIILRQGRSLREIEGRIGPPVPPAAAPSLERVRAVAASPAPSGAVEVAPPAPSSPSAPAAPQAAPPPEAAPERPHQTARQAAEARAGEKARAAEDRYAARAAGGSPERGTGRGLVLGAVIIVIVGLLGAGGW